MLSKQFRFKMLGVFSYGIVAIVVKGVVVLSVCSVAPVQHRPGQQFVSYSWRKQDSIQIENNIVGGSLLAHILLFSLAG